MATNPVDVGIPRDQAGIVSCMCNAAYFQKVTIQWPSGGATEIFEGTGEDVQMKTSNGHTVAPVRPNRSPLLVSCLFEYSSSGKGGSLSKAKVKDPVYSTNGGYTTITVVSEDDVDDDYNDSYLTFSLST
jgi:hypothetical protein